MWKSIPALVTLREEIVAFLRATVEKGGENDYVTLSYLVNEYKMAHPHSSSGHHINQITDAIKDNMDDFKYRVLVSAPLVVDAAEDEDPAICFSCGNADQPGYRNAFQFYKLRGNKVCPFNYGCGCESDFMSYNYGCGGGIMDLI